MVVDSPGSLRREVYIDDGYCGWWYCSTSAFIIKWVIVAVIVLIFVAWFLGGYIHAKRRMKKGLQPLAYHRFLVSRRQRERYFPQQPQNNVTFYNNQTGRYETYGQGYPMQPWVPPPPAYGDQGYVPPYPGAPGATKVNPDQSYANTTGPAFGSSSNPPPPQAPPQAATTIRELDAANNVRDSNGINTTLTPSGPSQPFPPTIHQAK